MVNIGRFRGAGDIFESVGDYEQAVDSFIRAQDFQRAETCAQ